MKKIKWMLLNVSLSISDMVAKLKTQSYTDENGKGFLFDKIRDHEINGRYVEKITFQDTIPTLYGESSTFERIEYRVVEFYINKDSLPIIALINPPRSLKPFAISLVKTLGLGISLEEIDVEPISWVDSIATETPLDIIQIEISQMTVSPNALAKMQISSSKDLRDYYNNNFPEKNKSRVDRVIISVISPSYNGKVKITRSGLAIIDTKHEKDFTEVLYNSLIKTHKKK
jgi:hypothetical protein